MRNTTFISLSEFRAAGPLGLVASGKRPIRQGLQYERFFDRSALVGDEVTLNDSGSLEQTISNMKMIVRKYNAQTKKIAQHLKGSSREATLRNLWDFLYHHVQYKKDASDREQLRQPLRTWADRRIGVDCDCYSIFISSVLTNLGIPHAFRVAAYQQDFQHVYVIAPKNGSDYSSYYTIDPVVDRFDYEVPATQTKDYTMKNTMLNGLDAAGRCALQRFTERPIFYASTEQLVKNNLISTSEILTQAKVPHATVLDDDNTPMVVVSTKNGEAKLPTVVTAEQATQLKEAAAQPTTQPELKPAEASVISGTAGGILASLLGIGGLCWWAFSPDKPALSGPPRSAQRKGSAQPARRKIKSLHI